MDWMFETVLQNKNLKIYVLHKRAEHHFCLPETTGTVQNEMFIILTARSNSDKTKYTLTFNHKPPYQHEYNVTIRLLVFSDSNILKKV